MKIAHVIDTLDPKQGGPPMIAFRIAAGQAALGHDVTMITSTSDVARPRVEAAMGAVPAAARVAHAIVPHVRGAPPTLHALWNPAAARAMRPLIAVADVVHFHSVWCGISALGAKLARDLGRPYAFILNGQLDPWSLSQSRAKKRIALWAGVRAALDGAGALHLGNVDERAGIAPLRLRTPIQRIIPNGVYLEEIDPLPSAGAFRARHRDFLGDGPFVLFLSRLHFKKGLDHLARAFALLAPRVPGVKLVVVGPEDGAGAEFAATIAAAGLSGRTLVPGPLYGREKLEALVDAAAFCLPSRQEGFSIAILEALACGTPVVVSENCHFPEVQAAGAGFSLPLDDAAIADGLATVLTDPARAAAMGTAARRLVAEHYTWASVARQTVAMYEEMLALPTRR